MKLQLALDRMTIEDAIHIAQEIRPYYDWLEVGTSLLKEFGMESLRQLRQAFPEKFIVADIKTFDNAVYEFELCFQHGADAATVMGAAPLVTVETCRTIAANREKLCMIDLLHAPSSHLPLFFQMSDVIVCIHVSKDQQESTDHTAAASSLNAYTDYITPESPQIALAGGLTSSSLRSFASIRPDVLIVGTGITMAADPISAAKQLYNSIHSA
jgi:3-hexulose-6-phosphate synthase